MVIFYELIIWKMVSSSTGFIKPWQECTHEQVFFVTKAQIINSTHKQRHRVAAVSNNIDQICSL